MELIGLSGYARSGKDETARVLIEEEGFQRIAFADKLRDFLYALNPVVSYDRGFSNDAMTTRDEKGGLWMPIRLRDVIDTYGWDGYKETKYVSEIRPLLQRLGTEAGRQVLWDSIWIDAAFHGLDPDGKYVVTDVRFPNEAEAVRERGGYLWRINRPEVGPANQHASEISLDDYAGFSMKINNDSTLEALREHVRTAYTYRSMR